MSLDVKLHRKIICLVDPHLRKTKIKSKSTQDYNKSRSKQMGNEIRMDE